MKFKLFLLGLLLILVSSFVTALTSISDCTELQNINLDRSEDYYLTNDINCSAFGNFLMIGSYTQYFTGSIEGNNHTISNINLGTSCTDSGNGCGFISHCSGCELKNFELLQLSASTSTSRSWTGALIGRGLSGTVRNVRVISSSIIGGASTGGFVGAGGSITFYDSYIKDGGVSGTDWLGSFTGSGGTFINCYASTTIASIGFPSSNKGGFSGNGGICTNTYWDTSKFATDKCSGSTGLSSVNMKLYSNYLNWDFCNDDGYGVWAIDDGSSYPCSNAEYLHCGCSPDLTPPVVTMTNIDTTYNETYSSLPLHLNFTTDEGATCSINNDNWSLVSTGTMSHSFVDTNETPESFYEVIITCEDISLNSGDTYIYFTVDRTPPFANYNNPSKYGDTSVYTFGIFNISVDASDNHALYLYNANITKVSDDTLMWSYNNNTISNQSINISEFYLRESLDVSSWENVSYRFDDLLCDAHTGKKLKKEDKPKSIKKETAKIEYEFGGDVDIIIESMTGDEDGTDNIEELDRNKPTFKYKKNKGNYPDKKTFKLKSNKNIQRINSDLYAGWFVVDDKYWVDFEDGEGSKVDVEEGINEWLITLYNPSEEIIFDSIGVLNCKSESFLFNFKQASVPNIIVYEYDDSIFTVRAGQSLVFDIEVEDNNSEDTFTYDWKINNVTQVTTEDFNYLVTSSPIGTVLNILLTVTDNSPFTLTDNESWIITIDSGYYADYDSNDLSNIVVDGIGTAGVAFVTWINILIFFFIIMIIISYIYRNKRKIFKR